MEEKEKQILIATAEVFLKFGVKSVTMDDIARELKMSKKTLYKYFDNKTTLVTAVINSFCEIDKTVIEGIYKQAGNAIDEIIEIGKYTSEKIKKIHPSVHFDLEKYYPQAWSKFDEHKMTYIAGCVKRNLIRGIKEELFRENINIDIVTRLYTSRIDMVFDAAIFPSNEFSFEEVHLEMIRYHIRGIASAEGIKYLVNLVNNSSSKFL